jgi:hypothetical protein
MAAARLTRSDNRDLNLTDSESESGWPAGQLQVEGTPSPSLDSPAPGRGPP